MKRLFLSALPALALMASCAGGSTEPLNGESGRVVVCGPSISDGDSLALLAVSSSMITPLDTAVAIDHRAVLQTRVGKPGTLLYVVMIKEGDVYEGFHPCTVILEPGQEAVMTLPDEPDGKVTFENSKSSELWYECQDKGRELYLEMEPCVRDLQNPFADPAKQRVAEQKVDSAQNVLTNFYADKIVANAPSAFSDILLGECAPTLMAEDSLLASVMEKLAPYADQMPNYRIVKAQVDAIAKTAEGRPFTDFTMMSIDGKQVTLSDIVKANKLTLLDFWASWCGPCRAEMPSVVKAYDAYGQKGLAIVGVSLDSDAAKWTQAVNDLGMKWTQISDLRGWQSEAARLYSVDAIPACFLINRDGVIVAKNLRGGELVEKIGELLE